MDDGINGFCISGLIFAALAFMLYAYFFKNRERNILKIIGFIAVLVSVICIALFIFHLHLYKGHDIEDTWE